jgi:hypothetical protein
MRHSRLLLPLSLLLNLTCAIGPSPALRSFLSLGLPCCLEATGMLGQGWPPSSPLACGRHASLGELPRSPDEAAALNQRDSLRSRAWNASLVSAHPNCACGGLRWRCQVCWNSVSAEAWNGTTRFRTIPQPSHTAPKRKLPPTFSDAR